jgi:prepilin-type N-terminal cleavage/methylation domain-containing protein
VKACPIQPQARPRVSTRPWTRGGFALLEVIMAVALFSMVATAMTLALDRLAVASVVVKKESLLLRALESELTELGVSRREPDAFGISVVREVSSLQARTDRNEPLDGLFVARVTATLDDGSKNPLVRSGETCIIKFALITPPENASEASPQTPAPPPNR